MKQYVPKKRTGKQNDSLHLYFKWLSEAFNEGGYNVQLVLARKMDLDWTPNMVKELLWRPAQKVILEKESTTELTKMQEIDVVYDHLNRHVSKEFFIHIPFPSDKEYQMSKLSYKK